jgi:hypothetical protein
MRTEEDMVVSRRWSCERRGEWGAKEKKKKNEMKQRGPAGEGGKTKEEEMQF